MFKFLRIPFCILLITMVAVPFVAADQSKRAKHVDEAAIIHTVKTHIEKKMDLNNAVFDIRGNDPISIMSLIRCEKWTINTWWARSSPKTPSHTKSIFT